MLNKIKTELSELLFLSRDALHIHITLGIYIAAMVLFRRSPASIVRWLVVLVAQLANELLDGIHHGALDIDVTGALRDIGNTMLWPTVVLLIARRLGKRMQLPEANRKVDCSRALNAERTQKTTCSAALQFTDLSPVGSLHSSLTTTPKATGVAKLDREWNSILVSLPQQPAGLNSIGRRCQQHY